MALVATSGDSEPSHDKIMRRQRPQNQQPHIQKRYRHVKRRVRNMAGIPSVFAVAFFTLVGIWLTVAICIFRNASQTPESLSLRHQRGWKRLRSSSSGMLQGLHHPVSQDQNVAASAPKIPAAPMKQKGDSTRLREWKKWGGGPWEWLSWEVLPTWLGGQVRHVRKMDRIVPFVYMVHKRVDYFRHAMESLVASDFPSQSTPLIVSHDGLVPEMLLEVQQLKEQFPYLIQLVHPYSCWDHEHSFPGDDPSLNANYTGDVYGNPRSSWVTCAKHHFTWMMQTTWQLDLNSVLGTTNLVVDTMFFMEEDYVVSPNIYETLLDGLDMMEQTAASDIETQAATAKAVKSTTLKDYFGLCPDVTDFAVSDRPPKELGEGWVWKSFRTGPMVLWRHAWEAVVSNRHIYCTLDEYNWDWTILQMQTLNKVPKLVASPSRPQVFHFGASGMHGGEDMNHVAGQMWNRTPKVFSGGMNVLPWEGSLQYSSDFIPNLNGGWGHPADHRHCLKLLGGTGTETLPDEIRQQFGAYIYGIVPL
eukprot:CAMPEP_0198284618 /NCGR_PEP_ID=MMETSP1449-20131203/4074_1 /TAXON_ID=420275 /ORGANISM="Attheya septentrionalis, Strain CCMP2084" /LENGTH=529 /DNA_ID=CAMNT_0043981779 /DNA_START=184 /DNA_END=1773 /DNA_ORIENTATION=-